MKKRRCIICKKWGLKADWKIGWNENMFLSQCNKCGKYILEEAGTSLQLDGETTGHSDYWELTKEQYDQIKDLPVKDISEWKWKNKMKFITGRSYSFD